MGDSDEDAQELKDDLEENVLDSSAEVDESSEKDTGAVHSPEAIRAELDRVHSFIARANALANEDSKFHALLHALTLVTERTRKGQGSGKLVVFTES